jgi:hypothetical protein
MSRTRYIVRRTDQGKWQVVLNGKGHGSYDTQDEAIYNAVETAHKVGAISPDGARVLAQRPDGTLGNAWTYGHDRFPL